MDAKAVAVLALVLAALCLSDGKPVSLSYRCPCRFFESHVARANIKHLKILNTPNCALQIVARLKNNGRQVCIDPKLKWIQEYLEKAINKTIPVTPRGVPQSPGGGIRRPSRLLRDDPLTPGPPASRASFSRNVEIFLDDSDLTRGRREEKVGKKEKIGKKKRQKKRKAAQKRKN